MIKSCLTSDLCLVNDMAFVSLPPSPPPALWTTWFFLCIRSCLAASLLHLLPRLYSGLVRRGINYYDKSGSCANYSISLEFLQELEQELSYPQHWINLLISLVFWGTKIPRPHRVPWPLVPGGLFSPDVNPLVFSGGLISRKLNGFLFKPSSGLIYTGLPKVEVFWNAAIQGGVIHCLCIHLMFLT